MSQRIWAVGILFWVLCAAGAVAADDIYQDVYSAVDSARLIQLLHDMTGGNPVTVNGETFSITDRYLPASKANFRKYFEAYFQALGMQVTELDSRLDLHEDSEIDFIKLVPLVGG